MKVNELRIGNYVKDPYNKTIRLVDVDVADAPMLTPIPLTEEWLVKFGFDSSEYKDGYIGKDVVKKGNPTTDFVLTKPLQCGEWQKDYLYELYGNKFVSIKHVHQLQNLFYAICGEELTLKNDNNESKI